MKKIILIAFLISISLLFALNVEAKNFKIVGMPNPWIDCGNDLKCASSVSGLTFPVKLSNYDIRAMKGMIEISYPLDEFRDVIIRKTNNRHNYDISGVYTKYPKNKKIRLENGLVLKIRGEKDKIYVVNMNFKNIQYSAYCSKGMTIDEIDSIYDVIKEAEKLKAR